MLPTLPNTGTKWVNYVKILNKFLKFTLFSVGKLFTKVLLVSLHLLLGQTQMLQNSVSLSMARGQVIVCKLSLTHKVCRNQEYVF